jgi:hypothetical protein
LQMHMALTEVVSDPTCVCRVPMFDEAVFVCVFQRERVSVHPPPSRASHSDKDARDDVMANLAADDGEVGVDGVDLRLQSADVRCDLQSIHVQPEVDIVAFPSPTSPSPHPLSPLALPTWLCREEAVAVVVAFRVSTRVRRTAMFPAFVLACKRLREKSRSTQQ